MEKDTLSNTTITAGRRFGRLAVAAALVGAALLPPPGDAATRNAQKGAPTTKTAAKSAATITPFSDF